MIQPFFTFTHCAGLYVFPEGSFFKLGDEFRVAADIEAHPACPEFSQVSGCRIPRRNVEIVRIEGAVRREDHNCFRLQPGNEFRGLCKACCSLFDFFFLTPADLRNDQRGMRDHYSSKNTH